MSKIKEYYHDEIEEQSRREFIEEPDTLPQISSVPEIIPCICKDSEDACQQKDMCI